jgi:hypothetical protein
MVRRLEARLEARAAGAQATQSDTDAELAIGASWIAASRALRAGMQAPLSTLADGKGTTFALEDALRAASVVLHFFRGCGRSFGEESAAGFFRPPSRQCARWARAPWPLR